MCGIAGYSGPHPLPAERIDACLKVLAHRGPDDAAHRSWEGPDGRHTYLLHRRLSIIDLDPRANQPFGCGDTWLATNGELYNYRELRAGLERDGVKLHTQSDTEVLAALLERDGTGALDGCEGMWAFASYNTARGELTLCRDRFGEKPLYLLRDGDELYFASEIQALFTLRGRPAPPDLGHLRRYLVNGYKSLYKVEDTFFEGVRELPAGTALVVDRDGRERAETYWDRSPRPQAADMSYEEAVAGVRERVIRAVELRLRADVPIAFCLSGGVDSQTLVSVAKRVFDHEVHGFTIVNTDERYEEQAVIDAAVSELGIAHHAVQLDTSGFLPSLRELVSKNGAPIYTVTYYVHWLLMEAISSHGYRVSISGTAADELFSGYFDHHLAYLREVHGDTELHSQALAAWRRHIAPIVRNPFLSNPDLFVADPQERRHIYLNADEFAEYLLHPFAEPFAEASYADDVLRNRMLNELFHEAVPVILHEDDLNAMSFSIENRSPFLDRELYEFSTTIPTRHLIRDGAAKAVLRDSMRGIVSDTVLDERRKVGFNAPIRALLDPDDPAVRDELLADGPLFDVVDRDRFAALLDKDTLPNSESKLLFNFLNAKLFLEEFGT